MRVLGVLASKWRPRARARRERRDTARDTAASPWKTHENGQHARADSVSMGPSALDQNNITVQSFVRSCDYSRKCCAVCLGASSVLKRGLRC